ncbi:MAG TPA: 4-hydroxyphenylacetate 3-hydroxylase N-terminal domain-containing protein [Stellaceae bacterium]|nr:4-hydroxyphenylacetate 3-hydroxylase N-terminal domain-containing protein [Stellaceae bacterium]
MGIRTGAEVLEGLRDGRAVYIDGERIADVTRDPRFAGGARTLASLYDLQHRPALEAAMTYRSPTSGDRVGLSFIEPKSPDELRRRRAMVKRWHDETLGMFGRASDFLNVVLSSFASGAAAFGGPYGANMRAYYELARERDLVSTHSLTNPQVDRSKNVAAQAKDLAAKAVRDNDKGIVIRGARMLATLGAYADELLVMSAPSYPLPETEEAKPYAIGFAIPVATPGVRMICRPSVMHLGAGSPLDYPLSVRYDETDGMVVFDDVLVPWERVFIYRDVEIHNTIYARTGARAALSHQFVTKDLAKAEFMMALAFTLARTTKVDTFLHIEGLLAERINDVEVIRACLLASEAEATVSPHGIVVPAGGPLNAMRFLFPQMFRRACESIEIIGAGGLVMVPSFAELDGPVAADVAAYCQAAGADSRARIKLFRLAHDAALSTFSGRQQLYERYFAGDPVRGAAGLYEGYDKEPHVARIWALLDRFEREAAAERAAG